MRASCRVYSIVPCDQVPYFLSRLGVVNQVEVRLHDETALNEQFPVDHPLPKVTPDQHNDDALGFAGLEQSQCFKQFIERPETAGKGDESLRAKQEVHFPDGKITKLKT